MTEIEAIDFLETRGYQVKKRTTFNKRPESHGPFMWLPVAGANTLLANKIRTRMQLKEFLTMQGENGLLRLPGIGRKSVNLIMSWHQAEQT